MYRLVGFDLDGTLLTDNKKISDKSYEDLYKLLDSKIITPVITTGRGFRSANKFFKDKGINIDIISNNGNIIRNSISDEILYINEIKKEFALDIISNCEDKANIYPLFHINKYENGYDIATIKKDVSSHVRTYPDGFGKRALVLDKLEYVDSPILSIVFAGEYSDLFEFKKVIERKYKKDFNIHLLEVKTKGLYILEVLQNTGDKWNGLKKYLSLKNIHEDETITVGDDNNDILMIKKAKVGIAMKNASQDVKESADVIAKYDNNEDGAMREVLKIIENKVIY